MLSLFGFLLLIVTLGAVAEIAKWKRRHRKLPPTSDDPK